MSVPKLEREFLPVITKERFISVVGKETGQMGARGRQFSSIITKHHRQTSYKEKSSQSVGLRVYGMAVHNGGDW